MEFRELDRDRIMSEHRRDSDQILNQISKIIAISTAILTCGAIFGWVKTKIEDHENRIVKLESNTYQILDNTNFLVSHFKK